MITMSVDGQHFESAIPIENFRISHFESSLNQFSFSVAGQMISTCPIFLSALITPMA
jgi:hypothetical protein